MAATQKFTNSALVCYTKLSPNHSGQRTHNIDTIAIHCMGGNCSIETCGNLFASASRKASSNYGIGSDGRIALYVEEKNRSWCTSSSAVDQRAVTIEVANNGGAPSWPISDKAMESLINLIVDIIQRNPNITELRWQGNKSLIGKVDKQNMVVHRWTAAKACLPIDRTELLTKNGWVKLKDVNIGDDIATVHIDNMNITFSPIIDMVEPRKQDTYIIRDLEATADHRIMYFNTHGKQHIGYFSEIFDKSSIYIPNAGYYNGSGIPLSINEIRLLVAIQADGHYMYDDRFYDNGDRKHSDIKKYYGVEFHLKKERKLERLLPLLDLLGYKPNINKKSDGSISIRIYDDKLLEFSFKWLNNKKFKWDLIEMDPSQAKYFLQELLYWDGSLENNSYFSKDIENRDIVTAIAAINGVGSLYNNQEKSIDISVAFKSNRRSIGDGNKIRKTNQMVSCVTVDSGFILIRQDRRTSIVGNCPGDYLYNKHPYIVEQVNSKLKKSGSTVTGTPIAQKPNSISGSTEKILWKFLDAKGLNDYAKAGIMGNLFAESGLESNNLQNTFEKKLGMSDEEYTAKVDNGTYKNFVRDGAGYGLCQWTFYTRKQGLFNYAKSLNVSIADFNMQCNYMWIEITKSYKTMLNKLKKAKSVREASDIFLTEFERPANMSETVKKLRASYGEKYYKKNADGDETTHLPYTVKVNDGALNIRKGPGTNYVKVGCIRDNGIYTIIEESIGKGAKKWGKLKSGAGWISLDYCIKTS